MPAATASASRRWSPATAPREAHRCGSPSGTDRTAATRPGRVDLRYSDMHGYGQYCPLARGAEVLGDRWTLLIIREMLFGVQRFNELERFLPGISRSVLAQ